MDYKGNPGAAPWIEEISGYFPSPSPPCFGRITLGRGCPSAAPVRAPSKSIKLRALDHAFEFKRGSNTEDAVQLRSEHLCA
jgi:hypothetical protein